MKPVLKIAIVGGGVLLALLAAHAAVALNAALIGVSDADAAGGMHAFGDLILFVSVFGVLALVPTGAALYFLLSGKKWPNKAPEPTPGAVTPRAIEGASM